MNSVQKIITSMAPRKWAAEMEAESRSWLMRCDACGFEQSLWEAGGIRWKSAGNPSRLMKCPQCGKSSMQKLYRKQ